MQSSQRDAKSSGVSWPLLAVAGALFLLFVVLGAMLLQPGRNAAAVPSALIGQLAPQTDLPAVDGLFNAEGFFKIFTLFLCKQCHRKG